MVRVVALGFSLLSDFLTTMRGRRRRQGERKCMRNPGNCASFARRPVGDLPGPPMMVCGLSAYGLSGCALSASIRVASKAVHSVR